MKEKEKNPKWEREGARIRAIREGLGLSRNSFAARLGISPLTLKGAELGHQRLGGHTYREAELLAEGAACEIECTESTPPYDPSPSQSEHIPDDMIATVIAAVNDESCQRAAQALVDATGMSLDAAMLQVAKARIAAKR